jgi:thiol-disulfide isomerase/thioredoxin
MPQFPWRKRTRWILPLCVTLLIAVAAFPLVRPGLARIAYSTGLRHLPHPVRPGEAFPPLTLFNLHGAPVEIGSPPMTGITVYNVFTSWCPSCRIEAPMFAREARTLRRRGIDVVGIDQGETAAAVSAFADQFGLRYPILIDSDHVTDALLGARVIPETLIVRNGIVEKIAVGPLTPGFLMHLPMGA